MEILEKIQEVVNEAIVNGKSFYEKGNKSAGTRYRGNLMELKKLADLGRKDVVKVRAELSKK